MKNIKISYVGAEANDEKRDAFYATRKELKVNGALTETIKLYRPFAPVMKSIEQKRGRPSLQWVCSSSDDIARHYLLRKEPRAEQYDTIAVFADAQITHDDKTAANGQDYIGLFTVLIFISAWALTLSVRL